MGRSQPEEIVPLKDLSVGEVDAGSLRNGLLVRQNPEYG